MYKRPHTFYFEAILGSDQEIELLRLTVGMSAEVGRDSQALVQIRQRDLQIAAVQVLGIRKAERLAVKTKERISRKDINFGRFEETLS